MDRSASKIVIFLVFLAATGAALFIPPGKNSKPEAAMMEQGQPGDPGAMMPEGQMENAGPMMPPGMMDSADGQMPPGHPSAGETGAAPAIKPSASGLPILIEFMSPECPVCTEMEPIVQKLAKEFEGKVEVHQVNVLTPEGQQLGDEFKVDPLPTFVMMSKDQQTVGRFENKIPEEMLRANMKMLAGM
jgi:thiol-disulfide isomerase/thioredoxin